MSRPAHGSTRVLVAAVPVLIRLRRPSMRPPPQCGSGRRRGPRCRPRRREHVDEALTDGHRPGRPAVLDVLAVKATTATALATDAAAGGLRRNGDRRARRQGRRPGGSHREASRRRLRRRSPRSGSRRSTSPGERRSPVHGEPDRQGVGSDHLRRQGRPSTKTPPTTGTNLLPGRPRRRDLRRPRTRVKVRGVTVEGYAGHNTHGPRATPATTPTA